MCINFLLEGFGLGREFYMTGLSACIPWQTDLRAGMSDISKSLDHRIGIEAIFGTLGETVAFSALSPPRHDWFAKLVYLAD